MGAFHISWYSRRGCHLVLHASLSQGLSYSDLYHACHWQLAGQVHFSAHMINMHRFRNRNLDQSTSAMLSDLRDLKGEVLLPSQKVGCPIWPFQWTSSLSVQPWGKSLYNCQFPQLKNIAQIPKICNYKTPFPSTQTTEQVRLDMHSHMIITTAFKNPVNKIASVLYCEGKSSSPTPSITCSTGWWNRETGCPRKGRFFVRKAGAAAGL